MQRLFSYLLNMQKIGLYFLLLFLMLILAITSCTSSKKTIEPTSEEKIAFNQTEGDTIQIASDKTEYQIIIIEPGFNYWLRSIAKPEGYYSQSYLENRNRLYVMNWNQRVLTPGQFDPSLYQLQIDYNDQTDYGYEVNYKLYNYFIYFQRKYNQRLGPFLPRI